MQYWQRITSLLGTDLFRELLTQSNAFTDHQWQLCLSSDHIQLATNCLSIYLLLFGYWSCDTQLRLTRCFLIQASLLYDLLSRLHQRHHCGNFPTGHHTHQVSLKLHMYKTYFYYFLSASHITIIVQSASWVYFQQWQCCWYTSGIWDAYETCNRTCTPLHTPKTLETC